MNRWMSMQSKYSFYLVANQYTNISHLSKISGNYYVSSGMFVIVDISEAFVKQIKYI